MKEFTDCKSSRNSAVSTGTVIRLSLVSVFELIGLHTNFQDFELSNEDQFHILDHSALLLPKQSFQLPTAVFRVPDFAKTTT